MVVQRREIWWAELDEPRGSEPGFLVDAPGNALISRKASGLYKDSVANVTLDRDFLIERVGRLSPGLMAHVDAGLKLVLDL